MNAFKQLFIKVLKVFVITCEKATFLLTKRQSTKLSFHERFSLGVHLAICKYCRYVDKELNFLEKGIDNMKTKVEAGNYAALLSDEKKAAMEAALMKELR